MGKTAREHPDQAKVERLSLFSCFIGAKYLLLSSSKGVSKMRLFCRRLILALASVLIVSQAAFPQRGTQDGVRLFEEGNYDAAVQALKKRAGDAASAAYYLGLSYQKLGEMSEAAAAYKKSFDNAMYLISIELIKKYRSAPQIKEDILLGKDAPRDEKIKAAYDSLSRLA